MITGRARLTGVIGWPVAHSKSPILHNHWLDEAGLDGAYLPLPIAPDALAASLDLLPKIGFIGFNVTVPHKQAVMPLLHRLDPLAERIGAVNLIRCDEQGKLIGSNSDAAGFLLNLQQAKPDFNAASAPIVMLGAGGAARAALVALLDQGAREIRLVNRSMERADALRALLGPAIQPLPWPERHDSLAGAQLLVNATSLGMIGQSALELTLDALPVSALVNDLVYAPLETELLRAARRRGNIVADGLGMLLHQARPSFAAWWGIMPQLSEALHLLMRES